jgi:hypothetical protein
MKVSKNVSKETLQALGELIRAAQREEAEMKKLHPKFYQWLRDNLELTINEAERNGYYLLIEVTDTSVDDEGVYAGILYRVWSNEENDWIQDENGVIRDIEYNWDEVSERDRDLLQHAHDWSLED